MSKRKDRTGEVLVSSEGETMRIIKCVNAKDIDIVFEDGTIVKNLEYYNFKMGQIKNPNKKGSFGEYLGVGKYNSSNNRREYLIWKAIFRRCYHERQQGKQPTYINCTVCDEWKNFQNFVKWYDENYVEYGNGNMALDKDILIKGNKIYSPDTCVIVDSRINNLFVKNDKNRGDLPIGVELTKYCKYLSNFSNTRKVFETISDAFNSYKQSKEKYIKEVADEYKEKYQNFPQKLYDAMYKWEVEVTD